MKCKYKEFIYSSENAVTGFLLNRIANYPFDRYFPEYLQKSRNLNSGYQNNQLIPDT